MMKRWWKLKRGAVEWGVLLILLVVAFCIGVIVYFSVYHPPIAEGQMRVFPPTTSTATSLAADPADCAANTFANAIAANGDLTCTSVPNAATTAVAGNTVSAIVARDVNGDFAARQINAALNGNAGTATALANNGTNCSAGNAPLGVDTAGSAEGCFDVATQAELDTHAALTSTAHGAVSTNTASTLVTRDASGNFSAGTITAALTGNASTATTAAGLSTSHFATTGSTPNTLTAGCGTGATISGTDRAGFITIGTTPTTACGFTFAAAWGTRPVCFAQNETAANLTRSVSTTAALTINGVFVAADIVGYMCHSPT